MEKVYNGRTEALFTGLDQKVLMFSMTSGTTGEPKYIPVTERFLREMRRGWNIFGMRVLRDHPGGWLRNILQISSPMNESTSPGGLPCGAISGLLAATQKKIVRRMYAAPQSVVAVKDSDARFYMLLRCGVGRDVAIITTANPSSTIKLIETGQAHAQRLIRDVADGTFSPPSEIAGQATGLKFRPNPALARRMEEGIKADGALLPRHFWKPTVLTNWTGGTLKLYLRRLKELFGDVPVRDIGLLASEGRFSVPLADNTSAGVAEINANFLEFIPVQQAQSPKPDVLRAHELHLGDEYFLVVTNWAGLWRYNIDDRVRVVDRLGNSPVFEFLSRGLHTANITGEKLTEYQVVEAMRIACAKGGWGVQRFIMQGCFDSTPYYRLSLEPCEGLCATKLAELTDQALCMLNVEYKSKRLGSRLGPVRALMLPDGEMDAREAKNIAARHNRGEQYKHKYLLTEILELVV